MRHADCLDEARRGAVSASRTSLGRANAEIPLVQDRSQQVDEHSERVKALSCKDISVSCLCSASHSRLFPRHKVILLICTRSAVTSHASQVHSITLIMKLSEWCPRKGRHKDSTPAYISPGFYSARTVAVDFVQRRLCLSRRTPIYLPPHQPDSPRIVESRSEHPPRGSRSRIGVPYGFAEDTVFKVSRVDCCQPHPETASQRPLRLCGVCRGLSVRPR